MDINLKKYLSDKNKYFNNKIKTLKHILALIIKDIILNIYKI